MKNKNRKAVMLKKIILIKEDREKEKKNLSWKCKRCRSKQKQKYINNANIYIYK